LTARPRCADGGDQGCAARTRAAVPIAQEALPTRFSEEAKIRVPDDVIAAVNLHGDAFHPEWNYTIKPKR
jgi:hypothetical protein